MGIETDADKIDHVLLQDGWHDVANRSFALSYRFLHEAYAAWTESSGAVVRCRVMSILAVKSDPAPAPTEILSIKSRRMITIE
jgi:hypothetical protein